MSDLEAELTRLIIETLGLEDLRASDMDPDALLFDGDWGLDSVDALATSLAAADVRLDVLVLNDWMITR